MNKTGAESKNASVNGVSKLVKPGPRVAYATPVSVGRI